MRAAKELAPRTLAEFAGNSPQHRSLTTRSPETSDYRIMAAIAFPCARARLMAGDATTEHGP
jgi:hypothetical protein